MSYSNTSLGSLLSIKTGKLDANASSEDGQYPFFTCAKKPLKIDSFSYDCECVLVAGNGDLNVKHYDGKFDAYQRTYILEDQTDEQKIHLRYVYYFLDNYLEKLRQQSIGGIIKYIKKGHLSDAQIPLPPLPEQKRIATILDAADALRSKRRQSIAELDTLLQATFLDMFGGCERPPVSIGKPTFGKSEKFTPLADLAKLATGHTPDRAIDEYWGGEIPWISLTDIRALDGKIAKATLQNVTEEGIDNSSSVILPKGTVCFSRTASVGFVTVMGKSMSTSQDFVNWVCGENLNPVYLMHSLRISKSYLLSKTSGSTHKTIYYRHAEKFQVYYPPLGLQQEFAAIVESIEAQKARMQSHLQELDTLFAALQQRAFNGEL